MIVMIEFCLNFSNHSMFYIVGCPVTHVPTRGKWGIQTEKNLFICLPGDCRSDKCRSYESWWNHGVVRYSVNSNFISYSIILYVVNHEISNQYFSCTTTSTTTTTFLVLLLLYYYYYCYYYYNNYYYYYYFYTFYYYYCYCYFYYYYYFYYCYCYY